MHGKRSILLAILVGVSSVAAVALAIGRAEATFPGTADESRLAFGININGNTDIYTVLRNGEAMHRLTSDPGFDACPSYSADGKQIAWCATRDGATEIWVMDHNGHQQQQLTHIGGAAAFPKFAPDGTKVVFNASPPGGGNATNDIFVINLDGTGLTRLTTAPGGNLLAEWSPDGKRIAFESRRTGISQVWVMNADGTDQVELTFDARVKNQLPDWSPDGTQIAFSANDIVTGKPNIWVMNADGTNATQLTTDTGGAIGPAWSPDGRQIAFLSLTDRFVYVMNADGTGRNVVDPVGVQFVPAWQPLGGGSDDTSDVGASASAS
jgi:Tol biopolymer transport system component